MDFVIDGFYCLASPLTPFRDMMTPITSAYLGCILPMAAELGINYP